MTREHSNSTEPQGSTVDNGHLLESPRTQSRHITPASRPHKEEPSHSHSHININSTTKSAWSGPYVTLRKPDIPPGKQIELGRLRILIPPSKHICRAVYSRTSFPYYIELRQSTISHVMPHRGQVRQWGYTPRPKKDKEGRGNCGLGARRVGFCTSIASIIITYTRRRVWGVHIMGRPAGTRR